MQLGHAIERAQLLVSLLLAQLTPDTENEEDSDDDWTSLLRVYNAFDAYANKYGLEVNADSVLDLLVTDPQLPKLAKQIDRGGRARYCRGSGPALRRGGRRLAGRLGALVNYDWPDTDDHSELLRQVRDHCLGLHGLVTSTYFQYALK